jgi:SAM-dependent methyltransferase
MARVDYDRMARVYDAGRDRTLDQRRAWREALGRHLPPPCGCPGGVLDLGAGTGQWARALTNWFGVPVVAVEPSAGMRAVADLAAASLGDALERVRLRADTVLRHLPDVEFHAGLRRLEAAAAAEDPAHPAGPIFGQIPLVVLAK